MTSVLDDVDAAPGDGACATTEGDCTLRAAIQESNALPGLQTILLPAGTYVLTLAGCCEDAALSGDLDITDDLSLIGADTATTIIDGNGGGERIFQVTERATASTSNLTLQGVDNHIGHLQDGSCGGGIWNLGDLTLSRVAVRRNRFRGSGAGICNEGTLRASDTTVELNQAALNGYGGGIATMVGSYTTLERVVVSDNASDSDGGGGIANGGTLVVVDSTISSNGAGAEPYVGGGGLSNSIGSATIINSTISGNGTDAQSGGGGVSNDSGGAVTLINSTVTANTTAGALGSGIANEAGSTITLVNTIVAGNQNGDCRAAADSATPSSLGHNLDGDGTCGLGGPGDLSTVDPKLGPLQDNGGPTYTQALLAGSPAIDAGDPAQCPAADQRGAPRHGVCDIGAFEANSTPIAPGIPRGDADCDGAVSPLDEMWVLRSAALASSLPDCTGSADVNCDGHVDLQDALLILKNIADLPVQACTV